MRGAKEGLRGEREGARVLGVKQERVNAAIGFNALETPAMVSGILEDKGGFC